MKLRYFNLTPLLLLFVLCVPSPAFAQSESGSINGLITDPGGAVIPGATVTVTDLGTNAAIATKTGAKGQYSFSTLRASRYKITVSAPGFKDTIVPDVELHTQDKLDQNVKLDVGSASDSVTLTADSNEQIETSAAVATTVARQFIENMPLNGRSFQALISLTPGNVTAKTYYTASGQFSIDGQRTDANYFSIDGVSANVGITQARTSILVQPAPELPQPPATTAATTISSPSTTCRNTRSRPIPSTLSTVALPVRSSRSSPAVVPIDSTAPRSSTSGMTSSTPTTGLTITKAFPAKLKSRTTSVA
jgi:hypothetical protein